MNITKLIKIFLIGLMLVVVAAFSATNTALAKEEEYPQPVNLQSVVDTMADASCPSYVDNYLRIGYNNDPTAVVKVQMFLNSYMNAGLVTDGIYGPLTEAAVKNFQLSRAESVLMPWNIAEPTGIFYLTTQTEVNKIVCEDASLEIPSPLVNWGANHTVLKPVPNPGTTALYLDISAGRVLGEETYWSR